MRAWESCYFLLHIFDNIGSGVGASPATVNVSIKMPHTRNGLLPSLDGYNLNLDEPTNDGLPECVQSRLLRAIPCRVRTKGVRFAQLQDFRYLPSALRNR